MSGNGTVGARPCGRPLTIGAGNRMGARGWVRRMAFDFYHRGVEFFSQRFIISCSRCSAPAGISNEGHDFKIKEL